MSLAADYLGGGFTSQLVQKVRVQRGLTYSVGAYASLQAEYGRAGINTFTKNETVAELLALIREILKTNSSAAGIKVEDLTHMKSYVVGNYPFTFEGSDKFLAQLMQLDHLGEPMEKLYLFPQRINALTGKELAEAIGRMFTWEEQVIVVVGDPSIRSQLEKFRQVEVVRPETLL
jgi:zinc protease